LVDHPWDGVRCDRIFLVALDKFAGSSDAKDERSKTCTGANTGRPSGE
jgi:hypothetical protein